MCIILITASGEFLGAVAWPRRVFKTNVSLYTRLVA